MGTGSCLMRDGISGIVAQHCQSPLGREDRREPLLRAMLWIWMAALGAVAGVWAVIEIAANKAL